jgi:hypothetical protein
VSSSHISHRIIIVTVTNFRQADGIYIGWETPLKEEPKIGESVTVYFASLQPAENSLTDFAELADIWHARAIVVGVSTVLFVAVALMMRLAARKTLPKSTNDGPSGSSPDRETT